MAEIVIRLDFRADGRWGRWLMTGAMMLAVVPELASESVTLTTYYPAPSGVYSQMITTGNTYLARDGGSVGVATASPAAGALLDVAGTGMIHVAGTTVPNPSVQGAWLGWNASGGTGETDFFNNEGGGTGGFQFINTNSAGGGRVTLLTLNNSGNLAMNPSGGNLTGIGSWMPGYANWGALASGSGGAGIVNDDVSYKTLMLVGNSSAGGVRQVSVWDQLNVNGNEVTSGTQYNAGGAGSANSYVSAAALNTNCYFSTYATGGPTTVCAGGYYVTMQSGYMSKYIVMNDAENPAGDTLCCQCPTITGWPWGSVNSCPNM